MTRWTFRALCALTLTLASAATAQQPAAQAGTVIGQVIAGENRAPLFGAQVLVLGTALRTGAGADGRFVIRNVPAGNHRVRVQLLGFAPIEHAVSVTAGATVSIAVEMKELPYAIAPMMVTALGISRSEKSLGYAAPRVGPDTHVSECVHEWHAPRQG